MPDILNSDALINDRSIQPYLKLLTLSICIMERIGSGKLSVCTKNHNVIEILIKTIYNKKHRKVKLTIKQIKALNNFKSPLCFDINTFQLLNIIPNKFKLRSYDVIDKNTILDLINLLIKSKSIFSMELKDSLKELKSDGELSSKKV